MNQSKILVANSVSPCIKQMKTFLFWILDFTKNLLSILSVSSLEKSPTSSTKHMLVFPRHYSSKLKTVTIFFLKNNYLFLNSKKIIFYLWSSIKLISYETLYFKQKLDKRKNGKICEVDTILYVQCSHTK